MNIKRLQLLVTLLEEIRDTPKPGLVFNLGTWAAGVNYTPADVQTFLGIFGNRPEVLKEGFCGTVACAVGHACLDERFNRLGLSLEHGQPTYRDGRGHPRSSWRAVEKFFDLGPADSARLFLSSSYPEGTHTGVQAVIDRIVELLTGAENSEQGHSPCP